jgi:hypothetical protein
MKIQLICKFRYVTSDAGISCTVSSEANEYVKKQIEKWGINGRKGGVFSND